MTSQHGNGPRWDDVLPFSTADWSQFMDTPFYSSSEETPGLQSLSADLLSQWDDHYALPSADSDSSQQPSGKRSADASPDESLSSSRPDKRRGLSGQQRSKNGPTQQAQAASSTPALGPVAVAGTVNNGGPEKGDTASQCSSCPSCVAPCDDNCDAQPCDETCEAEPCTDTCFIEPCPPDCTVSSPPCNSPDCDKDDTCTDEACLQNGLLQQSVPEAAAAAEALTSFADTNTFNYNMAAGTGSNQSYQNPQTFNWAMSAPQPAHGSQTMLQQQHQALAALTANSVPFDINSFLNSDQTTTQAYDFGFFNHLHEYHWNHQNPSHQHSHGGDQHQSHPCPIDSSNMVESTCRLPVVANAYMPAEGGFAQQANVQHCGYASQNPAAYADHVLTAHTDILRQWPLFNQPNPAHGHYNNNVNYMQGHGSYGWQPPMAQRGPDMGSVTVSSSAVPSGTATPLQQGTPSTSPSIEIPHMMYGSAEGFIKQPKESQLLDCSNAYQCFWRDPKSGRNCHQNFGSADDLDAHCRSEHVKVLERCASTNKKDIDKNGQPKRGYNCNWLGCKREGDIFSTRAKLSRHLQTHTGYKPMECPHCGMRLSAKQALDQHIRTHTHEHPYKCDFPGCTKAFKQHSALTMHMRTHTGDKPLRCDICQATFTESSNLSKHKRTHNEHGDFMCRICGKGFHRLDQLRRHLHANHDDQPDVVKQNLDEVTHLKRKPPQFGTQGSQSVKSEPPADVERSAGSGD